MKSLIQLVDPWVTLFMLRRTILLLAVTVSIGTPVCRAQHLPNDKHLDAVDRFYQIESWLPTPNDQRTASGAPGPEYWQQRADYEIDVTLDDVNQRIRGRVTINYRNESPHDLSYLWVQLDQNRFRPDSESAMAASAPNLSSRMSFSQLGSLLARMTFDGGYKIDSVADLNQKPMRHIVVGTMMRIDLDQVLAPGDSTQFRIEYSYNIVNTDLVRARGGYEFFEEDGNYIYEIAQWFPRVVSYTDYTGWQHKPFLGRGEFTLELGDYLVRITVPADMVVAATGELTNEQEVLKPEWRERLAKAREATRPMFIVTPEEAKQNEASGDADNRDDREGKAKGSEQTDTDSGQTVAADGKGGSTKTWVFQADNVRDFAFAASRKFIWDARGVSVGDQTVMAMAFYPNEAEPLWSQYSTEAVAHTLEVYGRYCFEYPYPVAISVNGPIYGMEYPMICFNGPRPEADGTYSRATKYGLISVVIHEVGHNFFPMIVNSDERQWTWMDEGLNTFLQFLAEQEWENEYPSRRGNPEQIVPYMRGSNQRPIMTGSEEILQFGPNAYSKPATALNILRETILGRELFDFAFREYARRWRFKRPTPSDFFRTMEDASGVDLDWFWRGWFYSTDHVDIAIDSVKLYQIDTGDPDEQAERKRKKLADREPNLSEQRNAELEKRIDWQPGLKDFYNSSEYDPLAVEESARKAFQRMLDELDDEERALLKRTTNFYVVRFTNLGGLVMPIIVRIHYSDNTNSIVRIPADVWRSNGEQVDKLFVSDKEIVRFELDPFRELADTEASNNHWPPRLVPSRFQLFKQKKSTNEMQKVKAAKAKKKAAVKEDKAKSEKRPEDEPAEKKSDEEKPSEKKPDEKKSAAKKPTQKSKQKDSAGDPKSAAPDPSNKENRKAGSSDPAKDKPVDASPKKPDNPA